MLVFMWGLIGIADLNHCAATIENLPITRTQESSLKILEFIDKLRVQREKELKDLRFEVVSLRRILKAKADANLK